MDRVRFSFMLHDAVTAIQILHMTARPPGIEILRVLHLDACGLVVGLTEHSDNLPGQVAVPVRRIVAEALACQAMTLVLSHNHPGGDPQPSRADIAATNHLVRIVSALGIRVHDHIVTGKGRDFSFRAAGML